MSEEAFYNQAAQDKALQEAKDILGNKRKAVQIGNPSGPTAAHYTRLPCQLKAPLMVPTNVENFSHYLMDARKVLAFCDEEIQINPAGIDTLIAAMYAIRHDY